MDNTKKKICSSKSSEVIGRSTSYRHRRNTGNKSLKQHPTIAHYSYRARIIEKSIAHIKLYITGRRNATNITLQATGKIYLKIYHNDISPAIANAAN